MFIIMFVKHSHRHQHIKITCLLTQSLYLIFLLAVSNYSMIIKMFIYIALSITHSMLTFNQCFEFVVT